MYVTRWEQKKKAEKSSGKRRHLISLDIVRVGFLMLPYAQPLARPLPLLFLFCQIERTRTTTTSIIIIKGLKTLSLWRQIEVTQLEIKCDSAEQFHNQMGTICSAYPGISWFLSGKYMGLFESRDCKTVMCRYRRKQRLL